MTNKIFKKLSFFLLFLTVISYNLENKAEAQACSWTKSGNNVCAKDLDSLYKMHPVEQLRQETTTVNGKLVNPPKPNIKDAPYSAAGNQKIGEPSNTVQQTGKTGTKSSLDIAREKQIAADNFRKQQEAAELIRQKNIADKEEKAEKFRIQQTTAVLKGLTCTMIKQKDIGAPPICVYPSQDKYGNWNINKNTLYSGPATYKRDGKEYDGIFKDGKFVSAY
jgi:hypothetical protein